MLTAAAATSTSSALASSSSSSLRLLARSAIAGTASRRTFFALARASAAAAIPSTSTTSSTSTTASTSTSTSMPASSSFKPLLSRVTYRSTSSCFAGQVSMRSYHSERPPLMFPDGLTSLSPSIASGCFLVSHPLANPGPRTVVYVIRCSEVHGVLGYKVPERGSGRSLEPAAEPMPWSNDPASLLATTISGMSSMEADPPSDAVSYTQLSFSEVESEIRDGQWMVVKHQDPWGIMSGTDASSLWEALLHSLGGQFSTLAMESQSPEEPPRLL